MAFYIPCPNSSYLITKNAIQKNYYGLDCWLKKWAASLHLLFPAFNWAVFWSHLISRDAVWFLPTSHHFPPQWFRQFRQRDNKLMAPKSPGAESFPLQSISYRSVWIFVQFEFKTTYYIQHESLHSETNILQAMKEVLSTTCYFYVSYLCICLPLGL